MASRRQRILTLAMIVLMLLATVPPIFSTLASEAVESGEVTSLSWSVAHSNGSGEQFAGDTVVMNATEWSVDATRGMDVWLETTLSTNRSFTHVDVSRDDRGRARACLVDNGGVWLAKLEFGGVELTQIEAGLSPLGNFCSIAIDEREKVHVAYTNESGFLRVGYQRVDGTWNLRTVENQTAVSEVKLLLNSDGEHRVVWLDVNDGLHLSTYGTWWTHVELLPGTRVGGQFDAYIDADDAINIFYRNVDTAQLIHGIRAENGSWSLSAVTAGAGLGNSLAFAVDAATDNVQYIYSSQDGAEITLKRDLNGQENGRLSGVMDELATGPVADGFASDAFNDLDFDCDGYDDLLVSKPLANSNTGAVEVYWGSSLGLTGTAALELTGVAGGDRFGASMDNAGDVNGDGCDDLLVGAPGTLDVWGWPTGAIYVYHGGIRTYTSANWSLAGESKDDRFGEMVSTAGDVNNDGYDDIIATAAGFTQGSGKGKVTLYIGSATGLDANDKWNTRGYWQDVTQGWSIAPLGDVNGDNFDDIALGAAGSFSDLTGNGRAQVYTGSSSGWMTLDNEWTTATTNTLLGFSVAGLGDLNNDGFNEFAFSEPLYDNSALGKVSVFIGTANGFGNNPALTMVGENSGQLFGSDINLIGDLNDDADSEIAISSIGLGNSPGKVEYFFADSTQLLRQGSSPTLADGVAGQHLGRTVSGGGDSDGDGQLEVIMTSTDKDMSGNSSGSVMQIEKVNSETILLAHPHTELDLDLDDSGRFHILVTQSGGATHLERPNAATDTNAPWEERVVTSSAVAMVVTRAGKTILIDGEGSRFIEQSAHTLLSTQHPLASHARLDLDLLIDGEQSHIFTTSYRDATNFDVEVRSEEDSGFLTSTISLNRSLGAAVSRDMALTHNATGAVDGWAVNGSGLNGSEEFGDSSGCSMAGGGAALVFSATVNNTTSARMFDAAGNSTVIQLWGQPTLNDAICDGDGTLLAGMYNALLHESRMVRLNGSNVSTLWSSSMPSGMNVSKVLLVNGGASPTIAFAIQSAQGDTLVCDTSSQCDTLDIGYESAELLSAGSDGDGTAWLAHDGGSAVRRMTLSIIDGASSEIVFTADANGDICGVDMERDAAGVVRIAACHIDVNSNNRLTSYRIYPDWDRDFIPSPWDDVPNVGGQWNDADGDGYGDNPDGPVPDSCVNSGTGPFDRGSRWGLFGCSDADWDGWADAIDTCLNDQGNSWIDSKGCPDPDGDGWSSPGLWTTTPDQDPINWYQQRDTDEDGHLDNHGPDCCGADSSTDIYPLNGNQWEDLDDDGWGDNHDFEYANSTLRLQHGVDVDGDNSPDWFHIDWSGDQCPAMQGFSAFDRGGCADSDGDGWSDPHLAENAQESSWLYDSSQCHGVTSDGHNGCADKWPGGGNAGEECGSLANCSQQWHDRDGDGYGDNETYEAWRQDAFIEDDTQWNDTDQDGYGDNPSGTTPDECPVVYGNSTVDRLGCPDSDGDGYSNGDVNEPAHPAGNADSNSSNPEQWRDTDGDGFGDFSNQTNGDYCPTEYGYEYGEDGRGCPLPAEDQDGDGIIDSEDVCQNTTIGETVDTQGAWKGCSENQKDDDGDGVANSLDRCSNTTAGATVDGNGCSDDQLTSDSDGDGVPDIDDVCPDTTLYENLTTNGCAPYQLDEDGDGVSNALDDCPGTAQGAAVDEVGCPRTDIDSDGDGYTDALDDFPAEPSQWGDYDVDGFGDNQSGFQGDACPTQPGNSTGPPDGDRWGCIDSDGDGWSDPEGAWGVSEGADAFINDPSQWSDRDGDGFGDNPEGDNADQCPLTEGVADGVKGVGCPAATDGEGNEVDECDTWRDIYDPVNDPNADVPEEFHSCDWYEEWYGDSESAGVPLIWVGGGLGLLVVLALLSLVAIRIIRGGDEWGDEDDDFYSGEDDDPFGRDDIFAAGASARRDGGGWRAPAAVSDFSGRSSGPPSRGGGPPHRSRGGDGGGQPANTGTGRAGSGANRPGGGPPSRRGPSAGTAGKTTRRKVVADGDGDADEPPKRKVRKVAEPPPEVDAPPVKKTKSPLAARREAEPKEWDDLFTNRDSANYQKSLGETSEALQNGEPERNLLRSLQTEGWNAKQSRFIIEEAQS